MNDQSQNRDEASAASYPRYEPAPSQSRLPAGVPPFPGATSVGEPLRPAKRRVRGRMSLLYMTLASLVLIVALISVLIYAMKGLADVLGPSWQSLTKSNALEWGLAVIFSLLFLPLFTLELWRFRKGLETVDRLLLKAGPVKDSDLPESKGNNVVTDLFVAYDEGEKLPVGQMVLRIFDEAKQGIQLRADELTHHEETRCQSRLLPFILLQRVALHLGILGAFLGLLGGLSGVGSLVGDMANQGPRSSPATAVEGLSIPSVKSETTPPSDPLPMDSKLLAKFDSFFISLAVCFRASVFGLGCWFVAVFLTLVLRWVINRYLERVHELAVVIADIAQRAAKKSAPPENLDKLKQMVRELCERSELETTTTAAALQDVRHALNNLTQLSTSIAAMNDFLIKHKDVLIKTSIAGQVDDLSRSITNQVNHMGEAITGQVETVFGTFEKNLSGSAASLGSTWGTELRSVREALQQTTKALRIHATLNTTEMRVKFDLTHPANLVAMGLIGVLILVVAFGVVGQNSLRDDLRKMAASQSGAQETSAAEVPPPLRGIPSRPPTGSRKTQNPAPLPK